MKQVESIVISVFVLVLVFMWLVPLVWPVGITFSESTFHMASFPNSRFTFGNLSYIWNAIPFARYYPNTLILVMVTFCVQFVTSTPTAYALAVMDFKGRILAFAAIFVQIIIPNDVLITLNFMILADMRLTDTKVGAMLPLFGSALAIFLLRQHFKSIPKAPAEAVRAGGASTWQTIWGAYIPCAKSAYMFFAVTSVSHYWNSYLWPLVVTNSPSNRTLTVGLVTFAKSKEASMQWASVCAATLIVILPLPIALFFL